MNPSRPHVLLLERAHQALSQIALDSPIVYVGGACVPLYLDDPVPGSVRLTKDVDCLVEVTTQTEYWSLEAKLRSADFYQSTDDAGPICRWYYKDAGDKPLMIDIMPPDGDILGFSNVWYRPGLAHAVTYELPSGSHISILPAPYFLGTKVEAFRDRGKDDPYDNPDLEDIVTVLDGRENVLLEIAESEAALVSQLAKFSKELLADRDFRDSLSGHLPPVAQADRRERLQRLVTRLREIAAFEK